MVVAPIDFRMNGKEFLIKEKPEMACRILTRRINREEDSSEQIGEHLSYFCVINKKSFFPIRPITFAILLWSTEPLSPVQREDF